MFQRIPCPNRQTAGTVQFQLHAGVPLFIRHLEEIDLRTAPAIFSSASIRPKRSSVVSMTISGASVWLKSSARGSGFGSGFLNGSGNIFKLLRIARSQYNSGEVASQTDSGGTSDALAGSSHNCDRILHDFLRYCYVMQIGYSAPIYEAIQVRADCCQTLGVVFDRLLPVAPDGGRRLLS